MKVHKDWTVGVVLLISLVLAPMNLLMLAALMIEQVGEFVASYYLMWRD